MLLYGIFAIKCTDFVLMNQILEAIKGTNFSVF